MGNMQEVKKNFCVKHKLYTSTVEISVVSAGLAIYFTNQYPGYFADIDIMKGNLEFQNRAMEKNEYRLHIEDM